MNHDSDSTPQRVAQKEVLAALNAKHGWALASEQPLYFGSTRMITLDGLDRQHKVAVEVNAHIGKRSASRDHKILQDAARLLLVRRLLGPDYKLILALCDETFHVSYHRASDKWHAGYLEAMDIDVELVGVSPETMQAVRLAQERQQLGNRPMTAKGEDL